MRIIRTTAALFLLSAFALMNFSLYAATKDFPLIDRDALVSSAPNEDSAKYPDADTITLGDYEYSEYRPDGLCEYLFESYVKALTEKGRRALSSKRFHYHTFYDDLKIESVEIIKADGRTVQVDLKTQSKEMVDSGQMGANIYDPNSKQIVINIPGFEIGDILHISARENSLKTRMPDTWSAYSMMNDESPIVNCVVEVSAPKALPLVHKLLRDEIKGTVQFRESVEGDRTVSRWEAKNVPQIFPEPNMPALYSVAQRLLLSTVHSWKDVSKWYWSICVPHLDAVNDDMKKKVAELCEGKKERMEKIEEIFRFVSRQIRYMGITPEKEVPGYEPHDVNITFDNRYGVCRDKAALLAAMLRMADFDAFPTLIMSGPKKDPDVPNPFFNHAVVAVDLGESKSGEPEYVLMDPTDENTKDIFPSYLCDKSYLVARPEGDVLRTSPIIPADKNMLDISTQATVSASGTIFAETAMDFHGINDGIFRGYFARLGAEERCIAFETILKRTLPSASLLELDFEPADIGDTKIPLKVRLKYYSSDAITGEDEKKMLELPWFGTSFGVVNFVLGETGLDKRKYPLETEIACGVSEKITVRIDPSVGSLGKAPDFKEINDELYEWTRKVSPSADGILAESVIKVKLVSFSPEQYLRLKQNLKDSEYEARKKPILNDASFFEEEKQKDADAESSQDMLVEKELTRYELLDEGALKVSYETVKKVLSYAGKKKNSEIKINYNPCWDDVKIEYARVRAPDGSVKEISEKEINMMDQAWTASAPRYPQGKILVASLPGVEENSTIEYKIVSEYRKRPFLSVIEEMRNQNPIAEKTFSVATNGRKIKVLELNFADSDPKPEKTGDFSWTVKNSPAIPKEKNLPPSQCFVPSLAFSDGDWGKYAKALDSALKKAASVSSAAGKKALEICADSKDSLDKIRKIRDFVATSIRGAGPAFYDLPMECFSGADTTLSDAYGNSADKAILLYSMLSSVGIQSQFVIASRYPFINETMELPNSIAVGGFFVQPLVKIDGTDIYLNDTNQYAQIGTTANEGNAALFLEDASIRRICPSQQYEDRTDSLIEMTIAKDGKAKLCMEEKFYGISFNSFKQKFSEITPEMRRRDFQETCAQISQSAKPLEDLFTDYSVYPGVRRISVEVDRYAVLDSGMLYFFISNPMNLIQGSGSPARKTPYYLGMRQRVDTVFKISLPDGAKPLIVPGEREYILGDGAEKKTGSASVSCKKGEDGKSWTIRYRQEVEPSLTPPWRFRELYFINDQLISPETETFLISVRN